MKRILRNFELAALLAAVFVVGGSTVFGQSDNCADVDGMNAVYQDVLANYKSTDPDVFEKAINSGKQFLEKYGTCDVAKQNADWIKGKMPSWEKRLDELRKAAVLKKFDASIQGKDWDTAYASANEYLTKWPNDDYRIHVIVPLGWIGYVEALNKNYKYDANSMKYAKMAIELLKAGTLQPKKGDTYGTWQLTCTGKDECISLLTFAQGYMTFFGENNKQAALPYYYEVTKLPGSFSKYPAVYGTIGDYYYDSVKKISDDLRAKIADQKDTDPDDVKAKKEADIKATIAQLNGYAERAMDAYSRAYTLAKADPKTADYAANIYKAIQALYTVRFQKQDGIDSWIATTVNKPFPDPTSPVAPIEPEPTTGPADTTGNSTGAGNGNGAGVANGTGTGAAKTGGMGTPSGTGVGAAKGSGPGAANGNGMGNSAAKTTPTTKPIKPRK
jgi:hypothetical protein